MGPRSIDRGNKLSGSSSLRVDLLQWGRDQLIAEMRRLGGREVFHYRLQWGRDQLIAEMFARSFQSLQLSCFNGAAIN